MSGIVFGAGFMGKRIAEKFHYDLISRQDVDVLNLKELECFLKSENPDIVVNAIGKTSSPDVPSIDYCEDHKEETINSNVTAASNLSTICSEEGIYFVHLSSGCIYYGNNNGQGYREEDQPNFGKKQFYARSKIMAENILKEFPGLILRIRMPIDAKQHPRNLIDKLVKYPSVIDISNSMTTIPHALDAMKILIDNRIEGIYNFTNPGTINAYEIMGMYRRIVDPNHTFILMTIEELNNTTKALRSNCYLNTNKLASKGIHLLEIHEAVEECLIKYNLKHGY